MAKHGGYDGGAAARAYKGMFPQHFQESHQPEEVLEPVRRPRHNHVQEEVESHFHFQPGHSKRQKEKYINRHPRHRRG